MTPSNSSPPSPVLSKHCPVFARSSNWVLAGLGVTLASVAAAQPRAVQQAERNSPGAASLSVPLPATSTAGNIVVIGVFIFPGGSVSSITDTAGTPFQSVTSSIGSAGFAGSTLAVYSGVVPLTRPVANTIVVTGPFPAYLEVVVAEYSGLPGATADLVDLTTPTLALPAVIGPGMAASTDDLLYWWLACEGAVSGIDGGGFTLRNNITGDVTADLVAAGPGVYAPTAFGSCNAMVSALIRFPARLDGGTDAGPVDAGPVDAGPVDAGPVDAGSVDAGSVDAGIVDAGVTASRQSYAVGCDCSTAPSASLVALLLLVLALTRQRR